MIGEGAANYIRADISAIGWHDRGEREKETEEKGDKDGDDGLLAAR
jgi:hypothetical protein